MRGLTIRLLVSYVLLAFLVLVGAGLVSYSLLRTYLEQADEGLRMERGRMAAQLADQLCQSEPTKSPAAIAQEVERAVLAVGGAHSGPPVRPMAKPARGHRRLARQRLLDGDPGHVGYLQPAGPAH